MAPPLPAALLPSNTHIERDVERIGEGGNEKSLGIAFDQDHAAREEDGWCEFSARSLSQRPQVWAAALPIAFIAARYDRSLSVTMESGRP